MANLQCPVCSSVRTNAEMRWKSFDLVRCRDCSLVFADPLVAPADLYDQAYEPGAKYASWLEQGKQVRRRKFHVAWAWRQFFRRSRGGRGKTLVDIGCSTGAFMASAQDRGWNTVGVEISERAAEIARENTRATVLVGTVADCGIPEGSVDAVTSWEVLEHVPDPLAFAASVRKILKPGGVWALSVPNWGSRWERATTDAIRRPPFHLTYWSEFALGRLCSRAGFVDDRVVPKPFAWSEEVGDKRWAYLPIALVRSYFLGQKANRLFGIARKPRP